MRPRSFGDNKMYLDAHRPLNLERATVLALLATFPAAKREITVDELLQRLNKRGEKLHRRILTMVLRGLEGDRRGRLIPGRHGRPSRFLSDTPLKVIGESAVGVDPPAGTGIDESDSHRLLVRPGWPIQLPGDLTPAEARRLIELIERLPVVGNSGAHAD